MALRFIFTFSVISSFAFCAQVLKVTSNGALAAVSHDTLHPLQIDELVCQQDLQGREIPVAKVLSTDLKGAIVEPLPEYIPRFVIGAQIHQCSTGFHKIRRVAAVTQEQMVRSRRAFFNLSVGANSGLTYFFPYLHFQFRVARQIVLGLEPTFFVTVPGPGEKVTTLGANLTGVYYFRPRVFDGFFLEGAIGIYKIKGVQGLVEENIQPMTASLLFGWQGFHFGRINLATGIGAQYIFRQKLPTGSIIEFGGIVPKFGAQIGMSF